MKFLFTCFFCVCFFHSQFWILEDVSAEPRAELSVPKTLRSENAETLRFPFRGPKDFSVIFLRFLCDFFCRFSGDFLRQNLRFSTLRFENAAIFLRLRFFGTLRCRVANMLKNLHTESQRSCKTLGPKPTFSDLANSSPFFNSFTIFSLWGREGPANYFETLARLLHIWAGPNRP